MLKIALFGTSADPPTAGHRAIVDWLSQHYDRVAVWASNNPFKSSQTSLEQRAKMLQLLVQDIDSPQDNIEVDQQLSSPKSLETLEKAKKRWHDAEFTLVVGSDLIKQLPQWYRVEALLQQVQLLVIPRQGFSIDDRALAELQKMGAVAIADLKAPAVSSTAYRQHQDPQALTNSVKAYIHQEQLYKCQNQAHTSLQIH